MKLLAASIRQFFGIIGKYIRKIFPFGDLVCDAWDAMTQIQLPVRSSSLKPRDLDKVQFAALVVVPAMLIGNRQAWSNTAVVDSFSFFAFSILFFLLVGAILGLFFEAYKEFDTPFSSGGPAALSSILSIGFITNLLIFLMRILDSFYKIDSVKIIDISNFAYVYSISLVFFVLFSIYRYFVSSTLTGTRVFLLLVSSIAYSTYFYIFGLVI